MSWLWNCPKLPPEMTQTSTTSSSAHQQVGHPRIDRGLRRGQRVIEVERDETGRVDAEGLGHRASVPDMESGET